MCEPATIAYLAVSAGSVISELDGQRKAGKAEARYQKDTINSNKVVAAQQMSDIRQREAQEAESLSRQQFEASIEGRQARSTAAVAAGDSGAAGQSVDALLSDMAAKEGRYREAIGRQKDFNSAGAYLQVSSIKTGVMNDNVRTARPIAQPNYLGGLLKIGAATIGAMGGLGGGSGRSSLPSGNYNTAADTLNASTTRAVKYDAFGGGGGALIA